MARASGFHSQPCSDPQDFSFTNCQDRLEQSDERLGAQGFTLSVYPLGLQHSMEREPLPRQPRSNKEADRHPINDHELQDDGRVASAPGWHQTSCEQPSARQTVSGTRHRQPASVQRTGAMAMEHVFLALSGGSWAVSSSAFSESGSGHLCDQKMPHAHPPVLTPQALDLQQHRKATLISQLGTWRKTSRRNQVPHRYPSSRPSRTTKPQEAALSRCSRSPRGGSARTGAQQPSQSQTSVHPGQPCKAKEQPGPATGTWTPTPGPRLVRLRNGSRKTRCGSRASEKRLPGWSRRSSIRPACRHGTEQALR